MTVVAKIQSVAAYIIVRPLAFKCTPDYMRSFVKAQSARRLREDASSPKSPDSPEVDPHEQHAAKTFQPNSGEAQGKDRKIIEDKHEATHTYIYIYIHMPIYIYHIHMHTYISRGGAASLCSGQRGPHDYGGHDAVSWLKVLSRKPQDPEWG